MDSIVIPTICQDSQTDYESELAVVIGKPCKNVSKEEALDYVAGTSMCNKKKMKKKEMELHKQIP